MALKIFDTLKPQGDYPAVGAEDILMPDGQRLSDFWRNSDVVLEEQTVAGFVDGGTWWGYGSADAICPNLVAGETYRVNWDGTEYICTAVGSDGGMVYVGDPGIAMDEGTGDYPFQIRTDAEPVNGSDRFTCLTTDEGESHEIAIYRGENKGCVKTINGVAPDENGNVEIEVTPGSGGVSSWNDLTDKPFYEESGERELYSGTLTIPVADGMGELEIFPALFTLVEGETYRVAWDGVEHECVCVPDDFITGSGAPCVSDFVRDENGVVVGGNFALIYGSPELTGLESGCILVYIISDTEEHTLAIYHNGTVIKPIDNKFLEPFHQEGDEVQIYEGQMGNADDITPAPFTLVEGETYRVVFDGEEYELVCENMDGTLYLMHMVTDENGEYTEGAFAIYYASSESSGVDGGVVATEVLSETDTHTVAIYQKNEIVWKLNEECLPMDAIDKRIEEYISAALEGDY